MIRILLADDHEILRGGLRSLINAESDMQVVGEASSGVQALQLAKQLNPHLVLLDISMPEMGGMDTLPRLRKEAPDCKVLMFTVHEDESLLRKAIRAGASGYVVKRAAESELINAIRSVVQGNIYIHPTMTSALLKDLEDERPHSHPAVTSLTQREEEVLRLIARGYTNNQIAELLSLSPRTVEGHRANLMSKLNLRSRVEIVEYAEEHDLLD